MVRKQLLTVLTVALVITIATGCSYRRPNTTTPGPTGQGQGSPDQSGPGQTGPAGGVPQAPSGTAVPNEADQLRDIANAVPGVNSSYVVVVTNLALVGIDLRDTMTAAQTEDLKKRVSDTITTRDPRIRQVLVTADPNLVTRLRNLGDRITRGEPISGVWDELTKMLQQLKPVTSTAK
jgi:YhcN/YlaJ family sporulation lipoprotein